MYKIFGDKGFRLNIWEMTQKYYPELAKDNICLITNANREYTGRYANGKIRSSQEVKETKTKNITDWGMGKNIVDFTEPSSFLGPPVVKGLKLHINETVVKVVKVIFEKDLTAWTSGVNPIGQDSLMPVFAKYE